jgi:hypothetical protein
MGPQVSVEVAEEKTRLGQSKLPTLTEIKSEDWRVPAYATWKVALKGASQTCQSLVRVTLKISASISCVPVAVTMPPATNKVTFWNPTGPRRRIFDAHCASGWLYTASVQTAVPTEIFFNAEPVKAPPVMDSDTPGKFERTPAIREPGEVYVAWMETTWKREAAVGVADQNF